ncbi:hypothetical protein [Serratia ureilytica]|uniref:Uncharacterized protein n=1 Tax=Serratia ureilytica TaxID=300181 RepID=A0A9X9C2B9_9GAMM|nr:hypothetical protein [Serratia ureilytica]TXE26918.1 hypothetical protein FOT63_18460 [Serratia ureilytica]
MKHFNVTFFTDILRPVRLVLAGVFFANLFWCSSSIASELVNRNGYAIWISNEIQRLVTSPDLVKVCPGTDKPGYYCTGVMIHSNEDGSEPVDWTQPYSSSKDNKLSFSYWHYPILKYNQRPGSYQSVGIVFWPAGYLKTDGSSYEENFTCGYPRDGASGDKLGKAECGDGNERCQDIGIFTADDYLKANSPQCGFAINTPGYNTEKAYSAILDIEGRFIEKYGKAMPYDEFILKPWTGTDVSKIPLMAFFVNNVTNGPKEIPDAVSKAQVLQLDYYNKSGLFAPVVVVTGSSWAEPTFSGGPEYQSKEIPRDVKVFGGTKNDYSSINATKQ